jgi:hypothetical protein
MTVAVQLKIYDGRGSTRYLQCGRRHNTDNRNRPNAHLVVTKHHGPLMAGVVSSFLLWQVNRATRRYSRSERVDRVHTQESFGATWGQQ